MPSPFRICYVLFPLIFCIATVILASLAIAGSTSTNSPVNQIYLFKMDLSNATSAVNSQISSVTTLEDLGISDVYSFGMWGFCKGSNDNNGNYSPNWCSTPEAMYIFSPIDAITAVMKEDLDIQLPSEFTDYINIAKTVVKVIFITGLIGVCTAFITAILTLLSFCSHVISCIAMMVSLISLLALAICGAAATGTFLILRDHLNDAVSTYGIEGTLGNWLFYGLIWGAIGGSLLVFLFNLFGICCGRTRSRRQHEDQVPMMQYVEKE